MAVISAERRTTVARRNSLGELPKKVWATAVMRLLVIVYGLPVLWFPLSSFKPAGELFSYPLTFFKAFAICILATTMLPGDRNVHVPAVLPHRAERPAGWALRCCR